MTKKNKVFAIIIAVLPLAGAAFALDSARIASSDQGRTESARNDSGMEATCREVVVDTDEGYGVTSRESRYICDENR